MDIEIEAAAPVQESSPPEQQGQQQGAPNSQSHVSFRRQRASRACETCHARKVRCDAASLGVPCTNCVAFSIECRIPNAKRKKVQSNTTPAKESDSERGDEEQRSPAPPPPPPPPSNSTSFSGPRHPTVYHSSEGTPTTSLTEAQVKKEEIDSHTYMNILMKPKFSRAPITEAGRVAFLGESSNLTLLVHDRQGSSDVVHYPLPENVRGSSARLTELDNVEIDILSQRGAFLLPPRMLCDELIEAYFRWIHPIVPVINRTKFMRQYKDPKNPPSLLLLQAILLAGSRVCHNPQLMDANGSTTPAALTFYKRAKALYDANYEDDRVTIVQSLLLMGWYWEGPEDVTKNVFYWTRVATIVAQGSGMHRSVENSQLSKADKRLWRRVWWTLFTRDRSVAVALGRPVHINLDDSDVEMVSEDDFIEDEPDQPSEYPPDSVHVQFFLQYVKLCEITGLVLSQQYTVAARGRGKNPIDLTHSDMALADWLQNCPKIVYWEMPRHHFWSALLHSNYYTTLCLLHRAHMPPNGSFKYTEDSSYPSRNIAFQAAAMITSMVENLSAHDQLRYCPAFIVYSIFSALIMHVYQMRSPVLSIKKATQDRIRTCMSALNEVSTVWLVGKMVSTLFESILGNKVFEERLQKAAGRQHRKAQQALESRSQKQQQQQQPQPQPQQQNQQQNPHQHQQPPPPPQLQQTTSSIEAKRKFDEMAIDFSVNTPQPQESYERSRPQTPSLAPRTENNNPSAMLPPITSPTISRANISNSDAFMGGSASRPHTRPATPFNPSYSGTTTPPDLYLFTRNSPNLSQAAWENFQPDHLFPESASLPVFSQALSPTQQHVDPTIMASQAPPAQQNVPVNSPRVAQCSQSSPSKRQVSGESPLQTNDNPNLLQAGMGASSGAFSGVPSLAWAPGFDGGMVDGHSPSDSWSSSSAQAVPSTLNVEDWFQFFGINGDVNGLNYDIPLG